MATCRPTAEQLRRELSRETELEAKKNRRGAKLMWLFCALGIILFVAILLFPVVTVHGSSMSPTVSDGSIAVVLRGPFYNKGDIIAYAYGNKTVTNRVVALPGDTVDIDEDGNVFVNGKALEEAYVTEKFRGDCDIDLPCTVPEGRVFVLGDNRKVTADSRSMMIGCIDKSQITGKTVLILN